MTNQDNIALAPVTRRNIEVYFGWSVPPPAPVGGFIDNSESETRHP